MPFGFFSDTQMDELTAQQSIEADLETRRTLVQQANQITSDKVATIFLLPPGRYSGLPQGSELPG